MRQVNSGRTTIRHFSGPAHCPRRGLPAIISAVERAQGGRRLCSVLWCSLRGASQWCGEDCLASLEAADRSGQAPLRA
jgi:hypothetical protein